MASHSQQGLIPSIFIILTSILTVVSAQTDCSNNGNYTSNSTYSANLDSLLSSLPTNMDDNGFHNSSVGRGAETAYAAGLCRGDVQLNICRECIQEATRKVIQDCPNRKQAVIYQDFCTLRISNSSFFGVIATGTTWIVWNTANASDPDQFNRDLRSLLDDLRGQAAAGGSLRKVAAGNRSTSGFATIYSMLQCSPDLSPGNCSGCLSEALQTIPQLCDGKIGCSVLKPSCRLRYETSSFYNQTRLEELQMLAAGVPSPPVQPPLPALSPPPDSGNEDNSSRTIIIVVVSVVGSCLLLLAICVGIIFIKRSPKRKRRLRESTQSSIHDIDTAESLQYEFEEIKTATNGFAEANKLGQGGFGAVYKGKLANGQEIAVKRLSKNSGQGEAEFKNEVLLISKLQHRNLVRLLGFSLEGDEKLLVYEFVQNASLDKFIFDPNKRPHLNWEKRYKIILGIARGLLYLHEDSRIMIIHRDLKAGNILLDRDMNPKIADFGMARLFASDATQGSTSRIVGTYGYMAPEYAMHGHFSVKSDVFSFGVLILEMVCGQKNNTYHANGNVDLLNFAWKSWKENTATNMIDPVLNTDSGFSLDVLRCIHIGLLCVQENPSERPNMASVVLMLGSSTLTLPLPTEPAFFTPSGYSSNDSLLQKHNSGDFSSKSSKKSDRSSRVSGNGSAITDLYPF